MGGSRGGQDRENPIKHGGLSYSQYLHIVTPVSTLANIVAAPLCGLVLVSNLACLLVAGWFPAAAECFNHAGWFLVVGLNGLTFPSVCPECRQSMSTTMSFVPQKPRNTKFFPTAALVLLLATGSLAAETPQPEEGFVSLFDGKTLDGWKVGENADVFQVRDGMIVMECPATTRSPAHLFYVGGVSRHDFKNFDLKVDVLTFPRANSGIYFHTKYQESGWPKFGTGMPGGQQPRRLAPDRQPLWHPQHLVGAGGAAREQQGDVTILPKPPVKDNVWYTQEVLYQNGLMTVKLDGKTMFEYKIPDADVEHKLPTRSDLAAAGHLRPPGAPSDAGPYQQGVLQEHPRQGPARLKAGWPTPGAARHGKTLQADRASFPTQTGGHEFAVQIGRENQARLFGMQTALLFPDLPLQNAAGEVRLEPDFEAQGRWSGRA